MPDKSCFHCGLSTKTTPPHFYEVLGEKREFCCHGCLSVCRVIVESGNADYYKHREGNAASLNNTALPELLDKLKIYDNEEIQREFVSTNKTDNWKEAWLILEEIRCAACLWLNERTLRALTGVIDVQMDYTGQQVRVRWNPELVKLSDILTAITNIGYHAHPFDPTQREALNEEQKHRSLQRIIFALILGMGVMQSAIGGYFYGGPDSAGEFPLWIKISRWVNVCSTFLLLAYPGQLFFRNAWRDLKNKTLGMDVPVALGLSVAWFGSLLSTIKQQDDVYFESIAMFVIFLLIARYIELRTRITATALLDRAAKIIPQTAILLASRGAAESMLERSDDSSKGEACLTKNKKPHKSGGVTKGPLTEVPVEEIPVIELNPGDLIQISPGETLPVDGIMQSSSSSFDESLITGESKPVIHHKGDLLMGGSINIDQVIEVEVTSGRSESTINEIHQLTQRSVSHRPYYVDIAEQVATKFVAVIITIAVLTYIFWAFWASKGSGDALANTIAVLIVTCPCALALAAPVSLSLGAAGLSKFHLLPLRMSSIEKLSHIDTLVFDKTGTLTSGIPTLEEIIPTADLSADECLAIAAVMEHGSHHPFGKAIIHAASEKSSADHLYMASNIEHISGSGVKSEFNQLETDKHGPSGNWFLGNMSFTKVEEASLDKALKHDIEQWRNQGNSVLYLSNEQGLQAVFRIVDPLREGIAEFLQSAIKLGIKKTAIISGDHQQSVKAIAEQLGITEAYGNLSPEDKLEWLQQQRQLSPDCQIMMFGDGINDAPTLAATDVSMTFSNATDLAKNHSDFILLSKGFKHLAPAFKLMRKTRKIILQNLGWAIAYNIIAVPAAVMGFVTPWMAAIGMSLSSLLVVLNSLRLK